MQGQPENPPSGRGIKIHHNEERRRGDTSKHDEIVDEKPILATLGTRILQMGSQSITGHQVHKYSGNHSHLRAVSHSPGEEKKKPSPI